jgi:hypothetical protein
MLLSIYIRQLSFRRRCELALISALVITSCTTLAASAQTSDNTDYAQDARALEMTIQQTNVTIASDKLLQQQYIAQVKSLKAELAALKKTPSNAVKSAQVQTQLNQAQQVEANLETNVTNLSKWVVYWQEKEKSDQYYEAQESLNRVASDFFDLNGDRNSENEVQADSEFQADQAAHDARLPGLHFNNTWSN